MTQNAQPKTAVTREARPPSFIAWHVSEKGEKSFWTRVGAAWSHQDNKGLTLQLDLVPVGGGRITLRAPSEDGGDPVVREFEAVA